MSKDTGDIRQVELRDNMGHIDPATLAGHTTYNVLTQRPPICSKIRIHVPTAGTKSHLNIIIVKSLLTSRSIERS